MRCSCILLTYSEIVFRKSTFVNMLVKKSFFVAMNQSSLKPGDSLLKHENSYSQINSNVTKSSQKVKSWLENQPHLSQLENDFLLEVNNFLEIFKIRVAKSNNRKYRLKRSIPILMKNWGVFFVWNLRGGHLLGTAFNGAVTLV